MIINRTDESIRRTDCIYRPGGVECEKKDKCKICGWNPKVEKARKKKL